MTPSLSELITDSYRKPVHVAKCIKSLITLCLINCAFTTAVERSWAVFTRAPNSQFSGFLFRFQTMGRSFTLCCFSSINCINEYLAIYTMDAIYIYICVCVYVCVYIYIESLCIIGAWLNATQRSVVSFDIVNVSQKVKCEALWAIL